MNDVELILLAGGAGSRMGGDKLRLRDSAGRLLVMTWFEKLHWPAPPRLVLPPDGEPPEELRDWPVARDAVSGEGPLRGVHTAFEATTVDWLLVVAVDTPGLGREQLDWLMARRNSDASARLWMTRHDGRIEPFPLLIHRDMAVVVSRRLAERRRSLNGLADEPMARGVDAPTDWPLAVWTNLNRPEDLATFLDASYPPRPSVSTTTASCSTTTATSPAVRQGRSVGEPEISDAASASQMRTNGS